MDKAKDIWVLPEIKSNEEEAGKISLGLLCESRNIAEKVNGSVTALVYAAKNIMIFRKFSANTECAVCFFFGTSSFNTSPQRLTRQ